MEIIALYNLKGGVGKTTGCVNLAYAAAKDNFKTLVWDLDPQGAATFFLGNKESNNAIKKVVGNKMTLSELIIPSAYPHLDLIPADLSLRNMDIMLNDHKDSGTKQLKALLKPLKDAYDFIFLDCPPGFSTLADSIFRVADIILMPAIPTTLSVRTYEIVKNHFETNRMNADKLMCYFNMVDVRKSIHLEVMQAFVKDFKFFEYFIPSSTELEKMGLTEKPLLATHPNSRGAQSFLALWQEIKEGVLE